MENIKQIIRICNADLVGTKKVHLALRGIRGISYSFSNAICNVLNLDKNRQVGSLNPEEIKKIEEITKNPLKFNIPSWLLNRRKDFDTGIDAHLVGSDLKLRTEFDIKKLKKIKSYKGVRHAMGQPVRGQRTRAHFRKGTSLGVKKKESKLAKQEKSKENKK